MAVSTDIQIRSEGMNVSSDATAYSEATPNWLHNLRVLWLARIHIVRTVGIGFVASVIITLLIPKMYTSEARIMPPESSQSSSALLAALAGRAFGSDALGGLAMSLMGGRSNGALFVDLLRSGAVTTPILDRFQLQSVYHKRYRVDAAKVLARRTSITQDKKSGVLSIAVRDTDPVRARDMAQAYLTGLNALVIRTSNSSAHQERVFIEKRLLEVKDKLQRAQQALSEFSSSNATIDLKEQARAAVESEAKVQGELIVAQGELDSLRQIYGPANIRVRSAEARITSLKRELAKMGGSSEALPVPTGKPVKTETAFLALRQVPRLAVPFANLYREVQVQETIYDLLTQQYELARIQEAKDIPVVNVIDPPGIPEKKSFPPRAILSLAFTLVIFICVCGVQLFRDYWLRLDPRDPRREFCSEVISTLRTVPLGVKGLRWRA